MSEPHAHHSEDAAVEPALHEAHFDTLVRQANAARLGMWVFLSSEALLFGGLFALYAAYRAAWPQAFSEGVTGNDQFLGTLNTVVLITSSWLAALSVHALRVGSTRAARGFIGGTLLLAFAFLVIKSIEYGHHIDHGELPGAHAIATLPPGSNIFFTLYFSMTGLHAIHVLVGIAILAYFMWDIGRGHTNPAHAHRLELGAMYWHLVDVIWIFLWPMFYLLR